MKYLAFEGVHKIICCLTEKERVSLGQVKTYVSFLDGIDVVWCFFHDMFSGVAYVDSSSIICIIGYNISIDGFSWSIIWVNIVLDQSDK